MSRSQKVASVTSGQRGSEQPAIAHRHSPAARLSLIRIEEARVKFPQIHPEQLVRALIGAMMITVMIV
jgi:hypothetical protein